ARKMASVFATGPTKAFGGLKRLLQTAFSDTMETQLDKESVSVAAMMRTHDTPHAIASFLNKEKPNFKGE
ncbi:MAG: enoyl-CoA hydratase, partial [Kiritimatiellae bacterium]|nr:enoyl-CoA hydratase [Kiritimatiellia bacterium]